MGPRKRRQERMAKRWEARHELMEKQKQIQNEHVQREIAKKKEEQKEMLNRALGVTQETEQTGNQTLGKLKGQREQLNRVQDDLDDVDDTLNRTENIITRMKRCFCLSFCMGNGPDAKQNAEEKKKNRLAKQEAHDRNAAAKHEKLREDLKQRTAAARAAEEEDSNASDESEFAALEQGIGNLNVLANQMNDEVTLQNDMIDDMNDDMDRIDDRFTKQNEDLKKLGG